MAGVGQMLHQVHQQRQQARRIPATCPPQELSWCNQGWLVKMTRTISRGSCILTAGFMEPMESESQPIQHTNVAHCHFPMRFLFFPHAYEFIDPDQRTPKST